MTLALRTCPRCHDSYAFDGGDISKGEHQRHEDGACQKRKPTKQWLDDEAIRRLVFDLPRGYCREH